jgi:hypothetical protein
MFSMLAPNFHVRYHCCIMVPLEEIRRRIDKKKRDLEKLEHDLRDGKVYLRALEDTYRLLEDGDGSEPALRPGSDLAQAQEMIRKAGRPLHVSEILAMLGKGADTKSKESLSGSLSSYARKGQVFTKAGPNKFGLTDMPAEPDNGTAAKQDEPPDDFGEAKVITDDDVQF